MNHQSVILFYWHPFQQTTGRNAAWNKCTALFHFSQLVGHFSLSPSSSFHDISRKTFKDMNLYRLPYKCLSALSTCQMWGLHSAFFRDGNKSECIWKGRCVQVWIWREETPAWSPLVCQHADSASLSRNILAFLQRTPIPILHVGSEESKRCTSEEYRRGDA